MTGGASGSGGAGGSADVGPHPGDVPGSTLASSMAAALAAAMIDCGLGLGGGVALLVSDGARRVGGLDVPRLRRALAIAVVLLELEDGRTERVERVGGRILVCFY
jgi:hypothetical protein